MKPFTALKNLSSFHFTSFHFNSLHFIYLFYKPSTSIYFSIHIYNSLPLTSLLCLYPAKFQNINILPVYQNIFSLLVQVKVR